MPAVRPSVTARLGAILLPAALAVAIAACSYATGAPPSSSPGATPAPTPAVTPTPTPDPSASPVPSTPADGAVDLDISDPHDVAVVVDNVTGRPVKVTSGRAGDGMSVRWGDIEVVNVDDSTLRVTWVGLPRDEQVRLRIASDDAGGGSVRLTFTQAAPPANSDATGYDRVVVLGFETPVSADAVLAAFEPAA
jgi:hypothetical protein